MTSDEVSSQMGRRALLRDGSLVLLGAALAQAAGELLAGEPREAPPPVRFGLVTDLHYADRPPAGSRHYRESLTKLTEAAEQFRQARTDFVVELGDFIDAADTVEQERAYLKQVHQAFSQLPGTQHYALGNHCVYSLTKPEFLETVGRKQTYYSFDVGGRHFVVLDACFRHDLQPYGRKNAEWTDANIPADEVEWLRADLSKTKAKTIVFIHQRLDVEPPYGVKNAAEIRKVLETSGQVVAVFQGHHHRNDYRQLGGIHYCTLVAMVDGSGPEENGYAIAEFSADGSLRVTGFRKQQGYAWPAQ
jgi:predicted phosphodiesterase